MLHMDRYVTRLWIIALALTPVTACSSKEQPLHRGPPPEVQLSLGGFQSDLQPLRGDRLGKEYVLPSEDTIRYFSSKGIRTFRLPMLWERMQRRVGAPLDPTKAAELSTWLDLADTYGIHVIADLHAFGRRDGHVLGTPDLPTDALVTFWQAFATRFKGRFAGYDIMNEPHDMPSPEVWPRAAQATVDAIRKVDPQTMLYVEGDDWSSAGRWDRSNAHLDIHDPDHKMVYSAHVYFDKDTSGQYVLPFDQDGASPTVGAERLQPFIDWLRTYGVRGHIGEFGVPYADTRWLPVLDTFLDATARDGDVLTGVTYWAAGDWADTYPLTVQPAKDGRWADRPQLNELLKHR